VIEIKEGSCHHFTLLSLSLLSFSTLYSFYSCSFLVKERRRRRQKERNDDDCSPMHALMYLNCTK
jgi:hypothetical protein